MTVKDAATNSLLMFVAATCVALLFRALGPAQQGSPAGASPTPSDSRAAHASGMPTPAIQDGVVVYYLHSNTRCPTCRTIEEYAKEAVESGFADALKAGGIQWQVINYESPGNEHYALDYNVVAPNVVLVKFKDGKQVAWKGLPEVWEHTGDKPAFLKFVQSSLKDFLKGKESLASAPLPLDASPPPMPVAKSQDDVPVPQETAPLPKDSNPMRKDSDPTPKDTVPLLEAATGPKGADPASRNAKTGPQDAPLPLP